MGKLDMEPIPLSLNSGNSIMKTNKKQKFHKTCWSAKERELAVPNVELRNVRKCFREKGPTRGVLTNKKKIPNSLAFLWEKSRGGVGSM